MSHDHSRTSPYQSLRFRLVSAAGALAVIVGIAVLVSKVFASTPPVVVPPPPPTPTKTQPPDWYVSFTDRFQLLRTVDGQATVSPGGQKVLVKGRKPASPPAAGAASASTAGNTGSTGAESIIYRVLDVDSNDTNLTLAESELRATAQPPLEGPIQVRVTDDGWVYFRTGVMPPPDLTTVPLGYADAATGPLAGEWQRYFPGTQHAKPMLDGFHVKYLSRDLEYAVGTAQDHPDQWLLIQTTYVKRSGVLRTEPLETTPLPMTVVGDTGVIQLTDGSFRVRSGSVLPPFGSALPWAGEPYRFYRGPDLVQVLAANLDLPMLNGPLPPKTSFCMAGSNRMIAFDGTDLFAIDKYYNDDFRKLILPGSEILDFAVTSEDLVVMPVKTSGGEPRNSIYRWSVLK